MKQLLSFFRYVCEEIDLGFKKEFLIFKLKVIGNKIVRIGVIIFGRILILKDLYVIINEWNEWMDLMCRKIILNYCVL